MIHIRTKLDRAEYRKNVLEQKLKQLISVEASKKHVAAAHAKFIKAYNTFSNIATRAAEQGLL